MQKQRRPECLFFVKGDLIAVTDKVCLLHCDMLAALSCAMLRAFAVAAARTRSMYALNHPCTHSQFLDRCPWGLCCVYPPGRQWILHGQLCEKRQIRYFPQQLGRASAVIRLLVQPCSRLLLLHIHHFPLQTSLYLEGIGT